MRETTSEQNRQEIEALPERSIISMRNAVVLRSEIDAFCNDCVDGLLDGRIATHYEFSLGIVAAVDAIARGTLDFNTEIVDLIEQMWHDVTNVTDTPNKITDIWGEPER